MIAASELESEVEAQVVHCARNESAAVKKERCVVVLVVGAQESLGIGNTDIAVQLLDKTLTQSLFVCFGADDASIGPVSSLE